MEQEFSEDSFKVASIACQLSEGQDPDEEHFYRAIKILKKCDEVLERNSQMAVLELSGATFSFDDALRFNALNTDVVDFGKVSSKRGLKSRITNYFPSRSELDGFLKASISRGELKVYEREFSVGASGGEVERLLRAEKSGIPELQARYLRRADAPRSSAEILKSESLTMLEMQHLSDNTYPIQGYRNKLEP